MVGAERWGLPRMEVIPRGTRIILGVEGDHDLEETQFVLDQLTAWLVTHPGFPLLVKELKDDCMVSPPERGEKHFEIRWIVV